MVLSRSDREALVLRVERKLGVRHGDRARIAAAVDQVVGELARREPEARPLAESVVIAVAAQSVPDLASRVQRALAAAGIQAQSGSATVGRHTVVTARVAKHAAAAALEAARRAGGEPLPLPGEGVS
jgi:hypothetical protein